MKCKILKEIGTLTKTSKGAKKLQLIEWDGRPAVYDLRTWLSDGKATSGVTFNKEDLLRIVELVEEMENEEDEELPINQPIEEEDDDEVIFTKATQKAEPKKTEVKKEKVVEVAKTDTHYTYDDCEKKLDDMFEKYIKFPQYEYVLIGLKEMAKVDDQFIQNTMRESRTFSGMMKYAHSKSREVGFFEDDCAVVDDDTMIGLCADYFNAKEEIKKVVETTKKTSKKMTKKTTTSTKSTKVKQTKQRVVKPLEIFDDEE